MNHTDIQWTWNDKLEPGSGFTWNPLVGCRRISKGCGVPNGGSCYAERLIATRLSRHRVYKGLAVMKDNGPQFTGQHALVVDRLDEPLRKRNPKGGRTFVCDLGDMFFEGHTFEEIAAVWGMMAAATHHTFQVLTKRPKRMAEWFMWIERQAMPKFELTARDATIACLMSEICVAGSTDSIMVGGHSRKMLASAGKGPWPLPNVWLGTSTEDQSAADERIPWLLRCAAPVRFLSIEPQCGPIDLTKFWGFGYDQKMHHGKIRWVIDGGWSGPGAGPFDLAWTRSNQAQCKDAGIAYFRKQLGARPVDHGMPLRLADAHGGEESEWPAELRGARAFPVPS